MRISREERLWIGWVNLNSFFHIVLQIELLSLYHGFHLFNHANSAITILFLSKTLYRQISSIKRTVEIIEPVCWTDITTFQQNRLYQYMWYHARKNRKNQRFCRNLLRNGMTDTDKTCQWGRFSLTPHASKAPLPGTEGELCEVISWRVNGDGSHWHPARQKLPFRVRKGSYCHRKTQISSLG